MRDQPAVSERETTPSSSPSARLFGSSPTSPKQLCSCGGVIALACLAGGGLSRYVSRCNQKRKHLMAQFLHDFWIFPVFCTPKPSSLESLLKLSVFVLSWAVESCMLLAWCKMEVKLSGQPTPIHPNFTPTSDSCTPNFTHRKTPTIAACEG